MNYTEDQLSQINNNLQQVNIKAKEVLKAIKNTSDIKNKDIPNETGISRFVVDKCIAAFLGCGLITMIADGTNKYYKITVDGERFLSINK